LDQISAEKTKISERLVHLDADRAQIATQLIDLETAERVMARVSKTPRAKRSTSAAAAEAKASTASRGRGRPPKTATLKSARRKPAAPSLGERVLGLDYRQNPPGTLRSVPQRSSEPCRHGGTAPYPGGANPRARRQTVCNIDLNGAGTRDSLTRYHKAPPHSSSTRPNSPSRVKGRTNSVRLAGGLG
jgi:hypothetical protein